MRSAIGSLPALWRRIHVSYMRRRIHVSYMRRRIHVSFDEVSHRKHAGFEEEEDTCVI
jgi:hypothetical protein